MQTRPCLSFRVFEETSLGELSASDVAFLNEAGVVLNSFCLLFLFQDRKSRWGYRGNAPAEIMDCLRRAHITLGLFLVSHISQLYKKKARLMTLLFCIIVIDGNLLW